MCFCVPTYCRNVVNIAIYFIWNVYGCDRERESVRLLECVHLKYRLFFLLHIAMLNKQMETGLNFVCMLLHTYFCP